MTELTPSLLVIDRSACGVRLSLSVAELLPGVGSVTPPGAATLATLTSEPVAGSEACGAAEKGIVPPTARLAVVLMLPVPLVAATLEPAAATAGRVSVVSAAGSASEIVAPVTLDGPLLVTTIV